MIDIVEVAGVCKHCGVARCLKSAEGGANSCVRKIAGGKLIACVGNRGGAFIPGADPTFKPAVRQTVCLRCGHDQSKPQVPAGGH